MDKPVVFGQEKLTIEDVIAVALHGASSDVESDNAYIECINLGAESLDNMLANDGYIYGVTTGYGESVSVHVPEHLVPELPIHLTRFHGWTEKIGFPIRYRYRLGGMGARAEDPV